MDTIFLGDFQMGTIIIQYLVCPLIVLSLVALLSNYFIPKITQKYQNHQKVLELKTELITELINCIMEILGNGDLYHEEEDPNEKSEILKNAKKKKKYWVIKKCVIGSKLHAYFPKGEYKGKELHKYFSKDLTNKFIEYCLNEDMGLKDWEKEKEILLKDKEKIIEIILEKDITVLKN